MGEEVAEYQGAYKVTQGLLEEFGAKRVIDTPITEYGFAGLGTGAAMGGLRPIVEFMTFNFAMQAIDHIINSAAKTNYMSGGQMRCPIVFRGPNGAAARVGAQHSQNYGPWYASVPGLIVIAPYSAADAKGLLKAAIRSDDPVVFLENELLYGQHFDVPQLDDYVLPIGKARIVRPGKDVTIVSYSIGVGVALEAAQELMAQGINAEVIDLRTLRPLDKATVLESLQATNRMVVVEEGWPTCSIAREIIAIAMDEGFDDLDAPVLRVTNVDVPLPYAANLEKLALIKACGRGRGGEGGHAIAERPLDRDLDRAGLCRRELRPAFDALFGISISRWPMWSRDDPSRRSARSGWPGGASGSRTWTRASAPAEPRLQAVARRAAAARDQRRGAVQAGGCVGCHCSSHSRGRGRRRGLCAARARSVRDWCAAARWRRRRSEAAGALWSLVDGARTAATPHLARCSCSTRPASRSSAGDVPAKLRPLTGLAALAAHDSATAGRARGDARRARRCCVIG